MTQSVVVDEGTTDPLAAFVADAVAGLGLRARYPDIVGPLEPVVLRKRANALIRLDPLPVVARVANWTASVREDPVGPLEREVRLSRWVAAWGHRAPTPLSGGLAGPHDEEGVAFTLWPLRHDGAPLTDPGLAGRSLAELHHALAAFPGHLPGPDAIALDANRAMFLLARMGVVDADEAMLVADECRELLADLKTLMAELPPERLVVLHGDAHSGNARVVDGVVEWFDFEDAWRGPIEWDVAVLSETHWTNARQREIALRQYCAAAEVELDKDLLTACRRLRNAQSEAWRALAAAAGG